MWGPGFTLPSAALDGLRDAFVIKPVPIEELKWTAGQDQAPAWPNEELYDAALHGLEYYYSVQHSSNSTDMAMAGQIMTGNYANTGRLNEDERPEWLQLAREYKERNVDKEFAKLDLESPAGQEQGIKAAIVDEARYELLAWECDEVQSSGAIFTATAKKATQNLKHPSTKECIMNNALARRDSNETQPGTNKCEVYHKQRNKDKRAGG